MKTKREIAGIIMETIYMMTQKCTICDMGNLAVEGVHIVGTEMHQCKNYSQADILLAIEKILTDEIPTPKDPALTLEPGYFLEGDQ